MQNHVAVNLLIIISHKKHLSNICSNFLLQTKLKIF